MASRCAPRLHLPSGRLRQYSLCGDPDDSGTYRIAVRRIVDGGGGSVEVHDGLPVGAAVTTHGPRNAFPLTVPGYGSPTRRFRFIAGGIGITPILPMLALAERLGVDWSMVYAGRSIDSLPFVDEVAAFGDRVADPHRRCQRRADGRGTARRLPRRHHRVRLRSRADADRDPCQISPAATTSSCTSSDSPRRPSSTACEFTVVDRVDGPGRSSVGADETLLAALRRSDVAAPYSCQQGFCGTCRTRVVAGAVDHRDTLLTEPERDGGMMLVCISRAADGEHLILDL